MRKNNSAYVNSKNQASKLCKTIEWQTNCSDLISTVEAHNSGQVGCPEIVPYCRIFPYFASSLFTYGHFGHAVFVPYFAVPYCERLLYCTQYDKGSKEVAIWQIDSSGGGEKLTTWKFWHWHSTNTFDV